MTSLSSILAFLEDGDLIATPRFALVELKAKVFWNETLRLRDQYEACVVESLIMCNTSLRLSEERERVRASAAREHNLGLAVHAEGLHSKCATARADAAAAVATWRSVTPIPTSPYKRDCSAALQEQVASGGASVDVELSAAHGVSTDYSNSSKSTVALLAEQLVARAAYDREYIYNKTLANVRLRRLRLGLVANFSLDLNLRLRGIDASLLIACATLSPPHPSQCPGESLRQMVNASQRRLYSSWLGAYNTWGDSVSRVDRYTDAAQDRLSAAASALAALAKWFEDNTPEFGGSFPGGISMPSLHLGRFGLDLGDVGLISPPEAIDALYAKVKDVVDRYEENLGLAKSSINADGTLLQDNLGLLDLGDLFDDYHPPTIDALSIQRRHAADSDSFEQQSLASARLVAAASSGNGGGASTAAAGSADEEGAVVQTNTTAWRWLAHSRDLAFFVQLGLTSPGVDFRWLTDRAEMLRRTLVGVDYACRAALTLAWLLRFWGRSTLPVSPVDVSTSLEFSLLGSKHKVHSQTQTMAMVMSHPLTLASVWACGALVAGSILWTVYEPWFNAYRDGCTARGYDSNGRMVSVATGNTVLATNAYAVSFNAAASLGNDERLRGLDKYDQLTDRSCSANGPPSVRLDEEGKARVARAINAHAAVAADVSSMRECYDVARIDADLVLYGAEGGELLSHALDEPACYQAVSNQSLREGAFNCNDALPECAIRCDELSDDQGRDASGLGGYATGASCTAEWWFHSWLIKLLACVALYLLLNVGRMLCVWGLVRVMWESLNTNLFAYLASCDQHGVGTYEQSELAAKLHTMLGNLKATGAAMLLASVLLQVPWIATLLWVLPELTYVWLA